VDFTIDTNGVKLLEFSSDHYLRGTRFKGGAGVIWLVCPSMFHDWIAVAGLIGGE